MFSIDTGTKNNERIEYKLFSHIQSSHNYYIYYNAISV